MWTAASARNRKRNLQNRRALLPAIFACACLFQASAAIAADDDDYANPDRPGIADGSNVVGKGHFQIETGIQVELRNGDGVHDRTTFVPSLFRIGISDRFEARIETNAYIWERTRDPLNGTVHTEGSAPISVGMKYHLLEGQGASQPSLGVIARVFPPSGSGDFKTDHWTGDLRLAADWDFAPKLSLNPNVGVAVNEDGQGRSYAAALFAITLSYNPTKQLNFFVDTGEQFPEQKNGRASAIVDAGIAYMVNKDVQLDLSTGTRASGLTGPHPFLSAGISKRF